MTQGQGKGALWIGTRCSFERFADKEGLHGAAEIESVLIVLAVFGKSIGSQGDSQLCLS